jgi:predicted ATPase
MTGAGLVGRREELATLVAAMTGSGEHRVALVTGDAGIGKTRLVWEACSAAQREGVVVLTGACMPMSAALPFLPITDALQGMLLAERRSLLNSALVDLPAAVADRLEAFLPGLSPRDRLDPPSPQGSHTLLLTALRQLLDAVGSRRRVTLVVEDLHWADESTLDLLTYLTRTAGPDVTVVVDSRADEPGSAQQVVHDWLAETARLPGTVSVALEPLDQAGVAELMLDPGSTLDRRRRRDPVPWPGQPLLHRAARGRCHGRGSSVTRHSSCRCCQSARGAAAVRHA